MFRVKPLHQKVYLHHIIKLIYRFVPRCWYQAMAGFFPQIPHPIRIECQRQHFNIKHVTKQSKEIHAGFHHIVHYLLRHMEFHPFIACRGEDDIIKRIKYMRIANTITSKLPHHIKHWLISIPCHRMIFLEKDFIQATLELCGYCP